MILGNKDNIKINKKEIYRYLGYKGTEPDFDMVSRIDACISEVMAVSEFRSYYQRFPVEFISDSKIKIGEIEIDSFGLSKNLAGCEEAFIFGATIGIGIDRLIARAEVRSMTDAAIYQAVGAGIIEDFCDEINREISDISCAEGKSTKPRFSPGYGDFSLEYQRTIFDVLKLSKHIGISLTEGLLMIPSKSVTAIVGVTKDRHQREIGHDCSACTMTTCPFRK